jgi:exodeoxyribonuclease-3
MGVVEEPIPASAEHAERSVRTSGVGPPNDWRVAALNILRGGGSVDRISGLVDRLLSYDADVLVVSEFRANRFGDLLTGRLEHEGYVTSHSGADPARNSVLIASRAPIDRAWPFHDELDASRLWCVDIGGTVVCGVFMPQKSAKLPYWDALIDGGRGSGVDLLIGDFNTGNNDLDKDPKGARFFGPETPGGLIESGYMDLWRSAHPTIASTPGSALGSTTDSESTTPMQFLNWHNGLPRARSTTLRDCSAKRITQHSSFRSRLWRQRVNQEPSSL